ncbi:MAG: type I-F CRISPR-associated endonuclease Cas1f [Dissulfuribacterales bacterium]
MEQLTDLKAILHSKRANLYYLEHCRVMQKDGRVLYLAEAEKESQYYNIPIANTTVILLGTGTSITQAAVRMLAQAGVLIGFCGGSGTPLFMGNDIEWLNPQSEYRPTEYVQGWLGFWFDDEQRLKAAKALQHFRIDYLRQVWRKDRELKLAGFDIADLVKDAIVLPWAFICAMENATEQEFRQQCLQAFTDHKALDAMFNQVKKLALKSKETDRESDEDNNPS